MRLKMFVLIIISEIFIVWAQVLFKKGANSLPSSGVRGIKGYISFARSALSTPNILGGLLLNVFSVIAWLVAISLGDLSLVMPLDSMHYIIIMAASYFLLKEKITPARIMGTLLVMFGMALVALG